jgi:hypothetical protein
MSTQLNRQLLRLSGILQLEKRARHAERAELTFIMVNETAGVMPYQQAALWIGDAKGRIETLSGVAVPEMASPYAVWLTQLFRSIATASSPEPRVLTPEELPEPTAADWAQHLPPHAVWVPLPVRGGEQAGGLLFARAEPWLDADCQILAILADAYAQSWLLAHVRRPRFARRRPTVRRLALAGLMLLAVAAGTLPVRQSVLAPAEIVPRAPTLARAPFEGVIDTVAVAPNELVAAGQPLLTFDTAQLKTKQMVALKARDVTQTEYLQAAQQAVTDPRAKAKLPILQGKLEQQAAEIAYLQTLLDRATLTAPAGGIAVFDDPNDWIGRPVTQGERIMIVADPEKTELEIRLPVNDALSFDENAEVALFLNVAPEAPIRARLRSVSYRAQVMPDGIVAYRLKAAFDEPAGGTNPELRRIGLKGTAKIYGETAPLILSILRRPLVALRQWLTL